MPDQTTYPIRTADEITAAPYDAGDAPTAARYTALDALTRADRTAADLQRRADLLAAELRSADRTVTALAAERDQARALADMRQGVIRHQMSEITDAGRVITAARAVADSTRLSRRALLDLADALNAYDAPPTAARPIDVATTEQAIERYADQLRQDAKTADDGVAVGLLRAADGLSDLLAAGLGSTRRAQELPGRELR